MIEGPKGRPEAPRAETYGANGITWAGKAGIGCRATNNVVYGNVHCGLKEMGHGGTGILMEANIIAFNGTDSGYDNGGGRLGDPARNTDDYNCYFPGKPHARILAGAHEILADPKFIDAKAGDYRLREDSPCVGKAVKPKILGLTAIGNVGAF